MRRSTRIVAYQKSQFYNPGWASDQDLDSVGRMWTVDLPKGVYYTPAHFSGRLVLNKQKGAIEHFRLGIPQNSTLNVTLTVTLPTEALIDIVHVERMEVRTEDKSQVEWTERLGAAEAEAQLKQAFYKFMGNALAPVLANNWEYPLDLMFLSSDGTLPLSLSKVVRHAMYRGEPSQREPAARSHRTAV